LLALVKVRGRTAQPGGHRYLTSDPPEKERWFLEAASGYCEAVGALATPERGPPQAHDLQPLVGAVIQRAFAHDGPALIDFAETPMSR
jgi:hypothetical protein